MSFNIDRKIDLRYHGVEAFDDLHRLGKPARSHIQLQVEMMKSEFDSALQGWRNLIEISWKEGPLHYEPLGLGQRYRSARAGVVVPHRANAIKTRALDQRQIFLKRA